MRIAKKAFPLTGTIIFIVVTTVLATLYFVMPVYYEQVKHREAKVSSFRLLSKFKENRQMTWESF